MLWLALLFAVLYAAALIFGASPLGFSILLLMVSAGALVVKFADQLPSKKSREDRLIHLNRRRRDPQS